MTSRSHQGLVRDNNEDCVYVDPSRGFALLADGMGGLLAGEKASQVAVDAARQALETLPPQRLNKAGIFDVMQQAHQAVQSCASTLNLSGRMGTTLALWVCVEQHIHFAHAGDSRIYCLQHDGQLQQLTNDQTVAQRLIDLGLVDKKDEHRAPNRHVLTQALGLPGEVEPELGSTEVQGRRYLICSDGLSDLIRAAQLQAMLKEEDLERCADALVDAALEQGGRDNISLVLADVFS